MDFLWPKALFGLAPFLLLLFFLARRRRKRRKKWRLAVSYEGFYRPGGSWQLRMLDTSFWLSAAAAFCLILVLAQPYGPYVEKPIIVWAREFSHVVDLSTSMMGEGIATIKTVLSDFVKLRPRDFHSLTGFGGEGGNNIKSGRARVFVFSTSSTKLLLKKIKGLEPRMLGPYTATGDGLLMGLIGLISNETKDLEFYDRRKTQVFFQKGPPWTEAMMMLGGLGPFKNKVLILFSDGYQNTGIDPEGPLRLATKLGIRVYFIFVPASSATGLDEKRAEAIKTKIKALALATGGKYFESRSLADVQRFYQEIDKIEEERLIRGTREEKADYAPYFVILVFGLLYAALVCRAVVRRPY